MKHEQELRDVLDRAFKDFMRSAGREDPHRAWDEWEEILFLRGFRLLRTRSPAPKDTGLVWTRYYLFEGDKWLLIGLPPEQARQIIEKGRLPDALPQP